jgi:hypothetical protein
MAKLSNTEKNVFLYTFWRNFSLVCELGGAQWWGRCQGFAVDTPEVPYFNENQTRVLYSTSENTIFSPHWFFCY